MIKGVVLALLVTLSGGQYIPAGPPGPHGASMAGLLDGWPMNEGSGTGPFLDIASSNSTSVAWNAASGGTNTWGAVGGWPGTPMTIATGGGWAGGGQSSGGSPNYASTGSTALSACIWFKATSNTGTRSLFSNSNPQGNFAGWEMGFQTAGNLYAFWANAVPGNYLQVQSTASLSAGVNNQICFTYDGSKTPAGLLLYINGSLAGTTTLQNTLTGSTGSNYIGLGQRFNSIGSPQGPYDGTLGYASVWSCVLTAGVISTNNAAGPSFTGLHC